MILRIFVMGLVALVPSYDRMHGPSKLTIVVPNLADHSYHQHHSIFAWDDRSQGSAGAGAAPLSTDELKTLLAPTEQGEASDSPPTHGLNGHSITFAPHSGVPLRFAGGDDGPSRRRLMPKFPTRRTADAFYWVPSFAILTGRLGYIDPAYYLGRDPELVAARMEIDAGEVKTYSLTNIGDRIPAMRFVGVGSAPMFTMRQAVADIVVIEIRYDSGQAIKFSGVHFLDSRKSFEQTLSPYQDGDTQRVDVLIANLTPLPDGAPSPGSGALHFDLYHPMLALASGYSERLFPRRGDASATAEGVDPADCELARVVRQISGLCRPRGLNLVLGGPNRPICMLATFQAPD